MRRKYYIISFLLILIIIFYYFYFIKNNKVNRCIKIYDELYYSVNNGEWQSNSTNDEGLFAWVESYVLESLINMYNLTGNLDYLEKFVFHADKIINKTDKKLGKFDYNGRSENVWSARSRYLQGVDLNYVWLVHTGKIVYPLIKFYNLINKLEISRFYDKANSYLEISKNAISLHDTQFLNNSYYFEKDHPREDLRNKELPYNQFAAMGIALFELSKVKKMSLLDKGNVELKIAKLCERFKQALDYNFEKNIYIWNYASYSSRVEDNSHGILDVKFALLCYQQGFSFSREDMKIISNTLVENVFSKKEQGYPYFLDGSFHERRQTGGLPYYIILSDFNKNLKEEVEKSLNHIYYNLALYTNERYDELASFLSALSIFCLKN